MVENDIDFINKQVVCPICRNGLLEPMKTQSNKIQYVCNNCNYQTLKEKPKINSSILKEIFASHTKWLERTDNSKTSSILTQYDVRGFSFADLDLSFFDFSHTDLTGCNFKNTRCFHTNFKYAICDKADFSNASLRGASIVSTSFKGAIMREVDLCNTSIKSSDFSQAELLEGKFIGSSFKDCILN